MSEMPFILLDYQVPSYPESNQWTDALRWLVCVMNSDDGSLHFIASLLSYAIKNEGLTERQAKAANKIIKKVLLDFNAGVLDCQLNEVNTVGSTVPNHSMFVSALKNMPTKGEA